MEKIKILSLTDNPLSPSGVGSQAFYLFKGLLETGRYSIRSMAGAVKHQNYTPVVVDKDKYGNDFVVFPVEGHGNPDILRNIMDTEKPDAIFLFTDPRFFEWVWQMEDEIRPRIPILYNHLWDNFPIPMFNKPYYNSCDFIGCINQQTVEFVGGTGSTTPYKYIPHALPHGLYSPMVTWDRAKIREKVLGPNKDRCVFLFVGRNARRKRVSDIMIAFSKLEKKYPNDLMLFLHTNPFDVEGPNLINVAKLLKLPVGSIVFHPEPVPVTQMSSIYNAADLYVNASSAEGFGLPSLESMLCGTRVLLAKTGGMKDQIINPSLGDYFEIDVQSMVGSQNVPYIYDDYCSIDNMVNVMERNYLDWKRDKGESQRLGVAGMIPELLNKFSFDNLINDWDNAFQETIARHKAGRITKKISLEVF